MNPLSSRFAKTVGRVVLKEAIATSVEVGTGEEVYGDLVRLLLIGLLEQPDNRFWKTLPRHLQVARVPCPPDLDEYTVKFRDSRGHLIRSKTVQAPLQKYRKTYVSFCRDIPGPRMTAN